MDGSRRLRVRPHRTPEGFEQLLLAQLHHAVGPGLKMASPHDLYRALALTVRTYLSEGRRRTVEAHLRVNPKFVYYLSAEYLPGRQLGQNLLYSGTDELARQVLERLGVDFDTVAAMDAEPALGNGGLGRLAACYLDSLATLDIPAVGYGLRYEHGIFKQSFRDGWQVEGPDDWLFYGNPWEFTQPDNAVEVGFSGHTEREPDGRGEVRVRWIPERTVLGEPYHVLVPGYGTGTVNILRLWRARASEEFDFQLFNTGDYARAVERKVQSETITKVLYPNENTPQGRELRLAQQYFFVACSLRDIIRRFRVRNEDWAALPDKAVIQLNDTHPSLAIPELMRILVDEQNLGWNRAWNLVSRVFAYTCHTLLPEALEQWPVGMFGRLLPRHLEIVNEINRRLVGEIRAAFPDDEARVARMSILGEGSDPHVRMAHLAATGSFAVNGVAELQSRLLRERTMRDFSSLWPAKFQNKTNGVTPRRFLHLANPGLSALITARIGDAWLTDLDQLQRLEPHAEDAEFRRAWRAVKQQNKGHLAGEIGRTCGVDVNPQALFDVMVKRLHEYKRQLLKVLHIITLYHRLKSGSDREVIPQVFVFGAKAAPGYHMAKRIIRLINGVADVVNQDPETSGRLAVAFLPNFNVSLAERIYPAADLSEQISLAGTEASGTGNMKFALNGALTIGTLDGANIEIRHRVGAEHFFLFGLTADEVIALRASGYRPGEYYERDSELRAAVDAVAAGRFTSGRSEVSDAIADALLSRDDYLLLADYRSYVDCLDRAALAYRDQDAWTRGAILTVARSGYFSSDRAVQQYLDGIWQAAPVDVEQG